MEYNLRPDEYQICEGNFLYISNIQTEEYSSPRFSGHYSWNDLKMGAERSIETLISVYPPTQGLTL